MLPCRGNLKRYNTIFASNILFVRAVVGPFPRIDQFFLSARAAPASRSYRPAAHSGLPIRMLAEYCHSYPLYNQISLPKLPVSLGSGAAYPRGSGGLTRPPRADSLTFKNRSESWCIALGQERSWREDIAVGRLHQLLEAQVQSNPQGGPLRCVSECQNTGPVGLEKLAASLLSLRLQHPSPPSPCNFSKDCSEENSGISS